MKIKAGDKVRVISIPKGINSEDNINIGDIGLVTDFDISDITTDKCCCVINKKWAVGCNAFGQGKHVWFFRFDNLEIV